MTSHATKMTHGPFNDMLANDVTNDENEREQEKSKHGQLRSSMF